MERLSRIQAEGFRSIRKLDLPLGDLTVLVGANGSGKSTFIGLFDMLNYMLSESLQLYVARSGGASSILHYGSRRTPVMRVEMEFGDEKGASIYRFALAAAAPDTLIFTDEHVQFLRAGESKPFEKQLGPGNRETNLVPQSQSSAQTVAKKVSSVFVNRLRELQVYHFHDTSEQSHIRTSQEIDRNRFLMSHGGNLWAFLYMLQERHSAHFDRILGAVRFAVPYLRQVVLEPDKLNPRTIQLRWRDRNVDYEFGAHQLSDGSLRAIALITALLQPEEFLPGLILIDEPELGLHPSAVGLIATLIKSAAEKRQVIVATQSPRLVSEMAPEDIVVVEREEDDQGYGHTVFNRLSKADLGTWLDDYDLGALYEMQVTGGGPQ